MKIAIFHNYMDNIGGAERVTLTLARELNADVYSTVVNQEMVRKMGFDTEVKTIGWIPVNAPLRQQIASWRFRRLNLKNKYDFFIISGDWAVSAAVHNKPNLWYVHSPTRELYDLYKYVRKCHVRPLGRPIFDLWVLYNRNKNRKLLQHVQKTVANSENVRKRLKQYLNAEATVIYPPIETSKYYYKKNGDFWLSVNRLLDVKRVDLQINAFKKMPQEKLIIVGCYERATHFKKYAERIYTTLPKNVKLTSWVDFDTLRTLYAECKGFLTTSKDEDFGMTAVEAMASGKPVIAPNEGGYKESVIHNVTGVLIDNIGEDNIIYAVQQIGSHAHEYKNACIEQAQKFDTNIFISKINKMIEKYGIQ